MSDIWRALAKTMGRIMGVTIVVCIWAIIVTFTLKVIYLVGVGVFV